MRIVKLNVITFCFIYKWKSGLWLFSIGLVVQNLLIFVVVLERKSEFWRLPSWVCSFCHVKEVHIVIFSSVIFFLFMLTWNFKGRDWSTPTGRGCVNFFQRWGFSHGVYATSKRPCYLHFLRFIMASWSSIYFLYSSRSKCWIYVYVVIFRPR